MEIITTDTIPELIRQVFSREIEFQATPILIFDQFAQLKDDLLATPGSKITMTKIANLSSGKRRLAEKEAIDSSGMSASETDITVYEWGYAMEVSELALQQSFDDIMQSSAVLLGRDYAQTLNVDMMNTLLETPNVEFARHGSPFVETTTRTDFDVYSVMSGWTMRSVVEELATNKAPRVNGDAYVCFLHPHQARYMREDGDWLDAHIYTDPTAIYRGEIGRYANVRFVETTFLPTLV